MLTVLKLLSSVLLGGSTCLVASMQHNKKREELHRLQEKHPELAARLARKVRQQPA